MTAPAAPASPVGTPGAPRPSRWAELSVPAIVAGVVVVLVSFGSTAVLLGQAGESGGRGPAGNGATLHATAAAEFASGVLTVASDSVVTLELRASSNGADEDAGANPERMLLESIVLDRTR